MGDKPFPFSAKMYKHFVLFGCDFLLLPFFLSAGLSIDGKAELY